METKGEQLCGKTKFTGRGFDVEETTKETFRSQHRGSLFNQKQSLREAKERSRERERERETERERGPRIDRNWESSRSGPWGKKGGEKRRE